MKIRDKRNDRRISLVELFCIVIILGTLLAMVIVGLSDFISNTNKKAKFSQENILVNATKEYLKDNKDKAPVNLGEVSYISLTELKNANYLKKENIKSFNKNCFKDSYVRVYKYLEGYTYSPYIYCNNNTLSNVEIIPEPIIELKFLNQKNEEFENKIDNVTLARLLMQFSGGLNTDGELLKIDNYNFNIYSKMKDNDDFVLSYKSEFIKADYENELEKTINLEDYIDTLDLEEIKIEVFLRNVAGGEKTVSISSKVKD